MALKSKILCSMFIFNNWGHYWTCSNILSIWSNNVKRSFRLDASCFASRSEILLTKNLTNTISQALYSPDMAPYDFFLIPRLKCLFRGYHYECIDSIKEKSQKKIEKTLAEVHYNTRRLLCSRPGFILSRMPVANARMYDVAASQIAAGGWCRSSFILASASVSRYCGNFHNLMR